jgi:hypothetical protein
MTADPVAAARGLCDEVLAAMARLRDFEVPQQTEIEAAGEVHQALLTVRERLDSAEALLLQVRRERLKTREKYRQLRQLADEEYDLKLGKLGEGAVRREYESVRDREVQARLHVLDLTRRMRAAETVKLMAEDTFESLTASFFGLLNIREELIARLRELQFESVLER